jgi:hypothetical protein
MQAPVGFELDGSGRLMIYLETPHLLNGLLSLSLNQA